MLAPRKETYDKSRQHIKKQRHFFANKGPSSQSSGFSSSHVWMWELDYKESWAWRTDAFELWCWRRLLRVLWTARRSNQSILKEISPACSLEGLMLKLKLQYFGHLMWRATHLKRPWYWERLKVGGEGDDRGWDGWMASPTRWTWVWVNSGSWWWTGMPGVLQFIGSQRAGHDWDTELNWTELRRTFVGKVMSLLLNMLSRLVITFLSRSKHLLISWLQSPSAAIKLKDAYSLEEKLWPT